MKITNKICKLFSFIKKINEEMTYLYSTQYKLDYYELDYCCNGSKRIGIEEGKSDK
ncbi:MAG TPA: hypothetical protein QF753_02535 [Victivallales bacterium]|nr:hypothetical protein [Victivallales bacterium]